MRIPRSTFSPSPASFVEFCEPTAGNAWPGGSHRQRSMYVWTSGSETPTAAHPTSGRGRRPWRFEDSTDLSHHGVLSPIRPTSKAQDKTRQQLHGKVTRVEKCLSLLETNSSQRDTALCSAVLAQSGTDAMVPWIPWPVPGHQRLDARQSPLSASQHAKNFKKNTLHIHSQYQKNIVKKTSHVLCRI